MVNLYGDPIMFLDTLYLLQECFHSHYFFMKFSVYFDKSSTHLKPLTGNFLHIAHPYKLLASRYIRYDEGIFLLYLLQCIYVLIDKYLLWSLILSLRTYDSQLMILDLLVFFKYACHASPGADKNKKDRVHIFQCIYL